MKNVKKAISEKRLAKIKKVAQGRQRDFVVVLEDIHDPHNAAAILRSCDGFGIQNVFYIFNKVKPYNPRKVGKVSSSSANKWIDFKTYKSTTRCLNGLKKDGYEVFATVLDKGAKSLYKTNFINKKIALLVGNEHSGLSDEAIKLSDKKIYIPMRGMVQSFNVSVTTAILIYEITRQRNRSMKRYFLKDDDIKKLTNSFMKR